MIEDFRHRKIYCVCGIETDSTKLSYGMMYTYDKHYQTITTYMWASEEDIIEFNYYKSTPEYMYNKNIFHKFETLKALNKRYFNKIKNNRPIEELEPIKIEILKLLEK